MRIKTFYILILGLFICACHGSPHMVRNATPNELKDVSNESLINAYNFKSAPHPFATYTKAGRTPTVRAELVSRNLVPESEWEFIDKEQIFIGMCEMGLFISWGFPYSANRTVSKSGARVQYIYRQGGGYSKYVYVEGGKITAWQD